MTQLTATALPGTVSRETVDRLQIFVDLFEKWSRTINLVARSTQPDLLQRHIADSLQLYTLQSGPKRWLDLGSGGGFPGAIVAIALAERNAGWVHLVESNQKKAAFLRLALAETGARGSVHAKRIEAAGSEIGHVDCVSARALADLSLLFSLAKPWLTQEKTVAYFHKGRDYRREVAEARGGWSFTLVEHPSAISPDSVILEIRKLTRRA